MGAITVKEFSAPADLTAVPDSQPGPGQVLIPVEAAGMNPMGPGHREAGTRRRDWAAQDTVTAVLEIVLTDRLLKEQ